MMAEVAALEKTDAATTNVEANDAEPLLHTTVYESLRERLLTGKIVPGVSLSTRSLAIEMGVSQMPIRDALSRLAAEGAVQIRSKRRIEVTAMTPDRFSDILSCRLLLEPEAAALALPNIDSGVVKSLREVDAALDRSLESGDVLSYMENNYRFHFTIYRANGRPVLNRLIEKLWLQFGPFMRVVTGRFGTANLVDQHQRALQAIADGNAAELRDAIAADISDGMGLVGRDVW